ncbi:MAG: hypothetical protein WBA93_03175 [Microcoleaceae cyanobacterium]
MKLLNNLTNLLIRKTTPRKNLIKNRYVGILSILKGGGAIELRSAVAIATVLLTGLFATGNINPPKATALPDTNLEDVAEDPEETIGQVVSISGEVEETLGFNVFRLKEKGELFTEDSILVINADPITEVIEEGEKVRVVGEVRILPIVDFEGNYHLNLNLETRQKLEAEYGGKPIIIADFAKVY